MDSCTGKPVSLNSFVMLLTRVWWAKNGNTPQPQNLHSGKAHCTSPIVQEMFLVFNNCAHSLALIVPCGKTYSGLLFLSEFSSKFQEACVMSQLSKRTSGFGGQHLAGYTVFFPTLVPTVLSVSLPFLTSGPLKWGSFCLSAHFWPTFGTRLMSSWEQVTFLGGRPRPIIQDSPQKHFYLLFLLRAG